MTLMLLLLVNWNIPPIEEVPNIGLVLLIYAFPLPPVFTVRVPESEVRILLLLLPILPVPEFKEIPPPKMVPVVSLIFPEPLAVNVAKMLELILLAPIEIFPLLAVV